MNFADDCISCGIKRSLEKDTVWLLKGPGSLIVESGSIRVNGRQISVEKKITVPAGRSILINAEESATIKILGELLPLSKDNYAKYVSIAKSVSDAETIIIIGPTDCGKSTLASFIINIISEEKNQVSFLTLDIGQNEIYAPGFASVIQNIDPPLIPGATYGEIKNCFIGSFSPTRALNRYYFCAANLSATKGSLIIDTDGWITPWDGIESKMALTKIVHATKVILLGINNEIAKYFEKRLGKELILKSECLTPIKKSRSERKIHRERLIAQRLIGAKKYTLSLDRLDVYGGPLFFINELRKDEYNMLPIRNILYAERNPLGIAVVSRTINPSTRYPGIKVLPAGWEKGLIAAAICEGKESLAVIDRVDYSRKRITIYSKCAPEAIIVGNAKISLGEFVGVLE